MKKILGILAVIILIVSVAGCLKPNIGGSGITVGNVEILEPTDGKIYYPDFITNDGEYIYHVNLVIEGDKGEMINIKFYSRNAITVYERSKDFDKDSVSALDYNYDYNSKEGYIKFTMNKKKVTIPLIVFRQYDSISNEVRMTIENSGVSAVITFYVELYSIANVEISNANGNKIEISETSKGLYQLDMILSGSDLRHLKNIVLVGFDPSVVKVTLVDQQSITIKEVRSGVWREDKGGGVSAIILSTDIDNSVVQARVLLKMTLTRDLENDYIGYVVLEMESGEWIAYMVVLKKGSGNSFGQIPGLTYEIKDTYEVKNGVISPLLLHFTDDLTDAIVVMTIKSGDVFFSGVSYDARSAQLYTIPSEYTKLKVFMFKVLSTGDVSLSLSPVSLITGNTTIDIEITVKRAGEVLGTETITFTVIGEEPEISISVENATDQLGLDYLKVIVNSTVDISGEKVYLWVDGKENVVLVARNKDGKSYRPSTSDGKNYLRLSPFKTEGHVYEIHVYLNWLVVDDGDILHVSVLDKEATYTINHD